MKHFFVAEACFFFFRSLVFLSLKHVWYLKGLDDNGDLWGGSTWGNFLNLWSTCKNWEPSISTSTGFFRCDGRWVVGDFRFTEMLEELGGFWVFFGCMISEEDGAISRNLKWLQESTIGIVTFCTWDQTPLGVNKDSRYPLHAIPSPSRNRTFCFHHKEFLSLECFGEENFGNHPDFWDRFQH